MPRHEDVHWQPDGNGGYVEHRVTKSGTGQVLAWIVGITFVAAMVELHQWLIFPIVAMVILGVVGKLAEIHDKKEVSDIGEAPVSTTKDQKA